MVKASGKSRRKTPPGKASRAASKGAAPLGAAGRSKAPVPLFEGSVLHFPGALTARDLAQLESHLSSGEVRGELFDAVLHDSTNTQYSSRRCDAAWLKLSSLPGQRKIRAAAKAAQAEWRLLPSTTSGAFQVEYEDAQYTEYRGDQNAHFKQWHVDADEGGSDAEDARAITIVALLAEPGADFEGGDFEVMLPKWPGGRKRAVQWRKGDLIAFPARKVWHRVMPTTAGLRKTLVVWAKDPTTHP